MEPDCSMFAAVIPQQITRKWNNELAHKKDLFCVNLQDCFSM